MATSWSSEYEVENMQWKEAFISHSKIGNTVFGKLYKTELQLKTLHTV